MGLSPERGRGVLLAALSHFQDLSGFWSNLAESERVRRQNGCPPLRFSHSPGVEETRRPTDTDTRAHSHTAALCMILPHRRQAQCLPAGELGRDARTVAHPRHGTVLHHRKEHISDRGQPGSPPEHPKSEMQGPHCDFDSICRTFWKVQNNNRKQIGGVSGAGSGRV